MKVAFGRVSVDLFSTLVFIAAIPEEEGCFSANRFRSVISLAIVFVNGSSDGMEFFSLFHVNFLVGFFEGLDLFFYY